MKVTRVLSFYIWAIAVLGTLGFFGWLLVDSLLVGSVFWPGDAAGIWGLSIAITAVFVLIACVPLQLLARRSLPIALLLGALAGPLFMCILLVLRQEPLSVRNYVTAPGVMSLHVLFGGLGLLFALLHHAYGPNNSFKPNPLR